VRCAIAVVASLLAAAEPAGATWSIVAVDRQTREVGVAAASCFPRVDQSGGLLPGVGAIAAQGISNPKARDLALELLGLGASPNTALRHIANETFDPQPFLSWSSGFQVRQYAIVALGHESDPASFTGSRTWGWSGSAHAPGVSVQGNMLRGRKVVSDALESFAQSHQCSLAERLLAALEAGSAAGGDRRCARDRSALSAYLEVAAPDDPPGASRLRLVVAYDGEVSALRSFLGFVWPHGGGVEENPVRILVREYFHWLRSAGAQGTCPLLRDPSRHAA